MHPVDFPPRDLDCSISGISSAVGEQVGAHALLERVHGDSRVAVERLLGAGFPHYRSSPKSAYELAAQAAAASLRSAGVAIGEVDRIVFATETLPPRCAMGKELSDFCERLGARETPVDIVTGHECGNLGIALVQAARKVTAEGEATVLVVAADACATDDERVCVPPIALMSDGAVGCIVRGGRAGSLKLRTASTAFDHSILRPVTQASLALELKAMLRLFRKAAASAGLTTDADAPAPILFTNNVSPVMQQMVYRLFRAPTNELALQSTRSDGHLFGAELLINCDHLLKSLSAEAAIEDIGMLFFGRNNVTYMSLEYTP